MTRIIDSTRIAALPRVDYSQADWNHALVKPGSVYRLNPMQSQAFEAMSRMDGMCGHIGVGHGKTFIVLLAGQVLNRRRNIVITTAPNVSQLRESYYRQVKPNFYVPAEDPIIISFNDLSTPRSKDKPDLLEDLIGDCPPTEVSIAVDEAHHIKDLSASRTFRVQRFILDRPEMAFVAVSGTLITTDIRKGWHLFAWALGMQSPLPVDSLYIKSWTECLHDKGQPGELDWRNVEPLLKWADPSWTPKPVRLDERPTAQKAFQARLRCAPGVVMSREGSIGTALNLRVRPLPMPREVEDALEALEEEAVLPNGEPIEDDPIELWRYGTSLSTGYFYVPDWPDGEEDAEYVMSRRAWCRALRAELEARRKKGYDSAALIAAQLEEDIDKPERERKLRPIHTTWLRWKAAKSRWGTAGPPVKAVWVSSYLVNDAVAWAKQQKKPVILWYKSRAVEDALRMCNVPVYGAGSDHPTRPITCAMSIDVHGTGKNLQAWSLQLFLEPADNETQWEQVLGRTHRFGQTADEVEGLLYQCTPWMRKNFARAVMGARSTLNLTGATQKLLYATHTGFDNPGLFTGRKVDKAPVIM
uniref:DEXDc domain containing protein n=1 Tax=uncultured Caudovirales phage TaxID=2100421 RepID=A0A6J5L2X4_9CAUD|nr:hypothetical protein UFOVP114_100 [uncultured Caudovirales phage]